MGLESATYIADLVSSNPDGGDPKNQGDNHLRMLKAVLLATFPNANRAFNLTAAAERSYGFLTKTSTYTQVATDNGKEVYFNLSGAANYALLAAATAGAGFMVDVGKDASLNLLTILPNGSEKVNEQASITLGPNEGGTLFCNGAGWYYFGWSSLFKGALTLRRQEDDAVAYPGLRLQRMRSGAAAINDAGASIDWEHKDSAGNLDIDGQFIPIMEAVTNGAESMALQLWLRRAGTLKKLLTAGARLSLDGGPAVAPPVALTDAATVAVDAGLGNNFSLTIGGNRTLGNPTNQTIGQSGFITITQDGTGGRTLAYASNWKFASGVAPVLSTAAAAVDILAYYIYATNLIAARLVKDIK